MKKLYEMPTVELTKFDVEDVITASSGLAVENGNFLTDTGVNVAATWNSAWDNYGI